MKRHLICAILLTATLTHAATVSISWDPPTPSNNVAGYKIYHGTAIRTYTGRVDVGDHTQGSVSGLDPTKTYHFAITAYNTATNESDYSAELVWDNDAPVIVSPRDVVLLPDVAGAAIMPNILEGVSVSDDFSVSGDIALSQVPKAGTVITAEMLIAKIIAIDEAGNKAEKMLAIITRPNPPGNLRMEVMAEVTTRRDTE